MVRARLHREYGEQVKNSVTIGPRSEQICFMALLGFLALCLLGGGGSRPDILSLLYLRPAAILCIVIFLVTQQRIIRAPYRALFVLLAASAGVIAIQLVPLPPDLWAALPNHERYANALASVGAGEVWRPISLTPDLTWNSLVSLVVPAAALLGFVAVGTGRQRMLLKVLLGAICGSAVLGLVQLSAGDNSATYLYRVTHSQSAVGFFANRNHQAALLAIAFPLLRLWTLTPVNDAKFRQTRSVIAAGVAVALVPVILVTGSRAGMALGLGGLLFAFLLAPVRLGFGFRHRPWAGVVKLALILGLPVLIALALFFGRAVAIERFVAHDPLGDLRVQHMPLLLRMTGDFFPWGSGFGGFDPVFRGFEPDAALSPLYFNRAHNDLIELALTGGMPALLVLGAFLIWWGRRSIAAFYSYREDSQSALFARTGAMIIFLLFAASLVDYPLRTPLMSVIFIIACGWLAGRPPQVRPASTTPPETPE